MRNERLRRVVRLFALSSALGGVAWGAPAAKPAPRAKPPVFTDADIAPFFVDARTALVGERPTKAAALASDAAGGGAGAADGKHEFEWSRLIDGDALTTEIKRTAARLATPLGNPGAFKTGGNKACRTEFALLAELFAVVEQFDGEVRFKSDAGTLRAACSRASANCKSGSDQVFAEATRVRGELDDLIRGGKLGVDAAKPVEHWSEIADRPLLMQRMQRAMQENISPKMGDAATFAKAAADIRQEAQVLAMLAEVIHRDGYDSFDDETFVGYARDLGTAAAELSRAAADENYEAARAAVGRAGQACATCHSGYRL